MTIEPMTKDEQRLLAKIARTDARFDFTMKAGGLIFLAAGGCLAWQIITWLKTASWPSLPFRRVIELFQFPDVEISWAGVQQIIEWIQNSPAWAALAVIGMFVLWTGLWGEVDYSSPALTQAQMKQAAINRENANPPDAQSD